MAVVVMGVAGSGKTTVAARLAEALGASFVEGDDLHPAGSVEKMQRGVALTDLDREPWLDRLRDVIADHATRGAPLVLTCSALKRAYRDRLRSAGDVRFVMLDVPPAIARARLCERPEHFMPDSLVDSQFEALEQPAPDERVTVVDGTRRVDAIVADVANASITRS